MMPANEKIARSVALEQAYVHDVYEQFSENPRNKPWPRVQQFLEELEQGAIVCDVGCGNGKYLNTNTSIFNIGGDKSTRLCEASRQKEHEVIILDNLKLPFRDESLDAALSIAVVHHLATTDRRIRALRELARVLRIGGRIIITVWAMEQSHRKFESQDVLVPWHRPQQLSTPSLDLTSTTTSEEDFMPVYHAYTQSDSDSTKSNKTKNGTVKKKGKNRHRGRSIDPGCSYSPSSSSLSSPNETCYSFVRRAIQKLAGGRRGSHRPWFLEGWSTYNKTPPLKRFDDNHCNCCDCDDILNLPIELRRVDDEEVPQRRQTFPSSQLISDIYSNIKSRSLTDIKTVENNNIVRSKSSVPSIQDAILIADESSNKTQSNTLTKPKLVKQKQSICDEDEEEDLDKPTDMKSSITILPDVKVHPTTRTRGNVLKQRSLNEELMSVDRFRENERVKQTIQKQASLNDDLIYRRHRKLDYIKDSLLSVSTSKKLQLIKTGFTKKIKNSTTNIERVTSSSLRNGFVRMFQNWKTVELLSPTILEDETVIQSPTTITLITSGEKSDIGSTTVERRHSKEDGSDSSKDSSLQSDTSVDSEDSFASVIFVPKADTTSPTSLSPSVPTSPRINNSSVPNSPRIKQSSCPTSPRIKQTPLSVYPLTKQLSSPRPTTSSIKSLFDTPVSSISTKKVERSLTEECARPTNTSTQTLAQKYSVQPIPKFRRTSLDTEFAIPIQSPPLNPKDTVNGRLKNLKEILIQKAESGLRSVKSKSNYPIVRRSSISNGNYDTLARPLPKLLSLELFNPETDDKDSDSSAVSSPDSVESVVENKTKVIRQSKFTFAPIDAKPKLQEKNSHSLLEAVANVASSLDVAVDKVIKSSPASKRQQLKSSDVVSVIYRQFETDEDCLLAAEETRNNVDVSWDVECQKHLTDFADKLSEKLLQEIDQYRENVDGDLSNSNLTDECIRDQYISRLSEELNDLSKLTEEIQKQNEYLAKLSLSDNFYNSLYCDNCKAMLCGCPKIRQKLKSQTELKSSPMCATQLSELKTLVCDKTCDLSESTTEESTSTNKSENKGLEPSDSTPTVLCRTLGKNAVKKGASIESCESEKGSSSNSVISSVATSVHFGLSTESTDGISDRGSSDSHKETSSISRYSDYGSTASLISCPDWATIRNKIPEERASFNEKLQIREEASINSGKENFSLHPSLSDTSQESLPSDNMGGAITYHRYYHVFREGELDQLIEKYVHNLHIISSYYDHASWCVVAEKVQVWTI